MRMQKMKNEIRKENDLIEIPRETLNEILKTSHKFESLTATLELLADKQALAELKEGLDDIGKGHTIKCNIDKIDELLLK